MPDVQIATQLVVDAHEDRFGVALLVSADSDLVPPTLAVRRRLANKRVIACFPPGRRSINLARAAHRQLAIRESVLAACQLPDPVVKADGTELRRTAMTLARHSRTFWVQLSISDRRLPWASLVSV